MPAYRSEAEAEVREAVVAHIRRYRLGARIIHEINACGFGNRIDVLAVDVAEIIAVEIKSEKDKIDRLPAQITAMRGLAHHTVAALHEKFLAPSTWNEGVFEAPDEARGAAVWAYPETDGSVTRRGWNCRAWEFPQRMNNFASPAGALEMLWRDELCALCGKLRVSVGRRANMGEMTHALRWHCTGAELTRGVCEALRRRDCIEADPPIIEAEAA